MRVFDINQTIAARDRY